ncbi:polyprenyl synthetase family protein [Proteinivorax hydrogeniformans]|uniref:Polyprenyl synthetase family protein n=1 Tax=Proteinivorax hydrogeniformans TaxID=1826727 RepID=A0AAU8HPW9_9FIRM
MLNSLETDLKSKSVIEDMLSEVEARLLEYTQSESEKSQYLAQYLIKRGGKRLRPLLVILSAGPDNRKEAVDVGVAAELIHTASLIHDDIVDSSKMRRGASTINSKWSDGIAVLVGDFLFAKAFEILSIYQHKEVLATFTKAITAMSVGEIEQLSNRNNLNKSYEQYYREIFGKTATLLAACCKSGGQLAGVSDIELTALETYGLELGYSFQVIDDLLDVVGCSNELGKPKFQDLKEGNITLPIINLLEKDQELEVIKTLQIESRIDFSVVSQLVVKANVIEYCQNVARGHIDNCLKSIEIIKSDTQKEILKNIAEMTLKREK